MSDNAWRFEGLDHVAVTTSNMERAVEFYNGFLGMPILHAIEYEEADVDGNVTSVSQHYFFGVGGENAEAHIGVFAFKDMNPESGLANPRCPGAFGHLNLKVDASLIEEYCGRLNEADIDYYHTTGTCSDPESRCPTPRTSPPTTARGASSRRTMHTTCPKRTG